jgi:hypothetical protein
LTHGHGASQRNGSFRELGVSLFVWFYIIDFIGNSTYWLELFDTNTNRRVFSFLHGGTMLRSRNLAFEGHQYVFKVKLLDSNNFDRVLAQTEAHFCTSKWISFKFHYKP